MYVTVRKLLLSVALTVMLPIAGASAGGLLGGNGGLLSVNGGEASNDSVVNVGLGSGGGNDGNLLDVNIGGSDPLATANVSTGGGNGGGGLLDGGLAADLDVDLGRLGVDADIGIGIGIGGGNGGPGGPGGPGNPGGPGAPGGNGGLGGLGGSGYAALGNGGVTCSLSEGRQVLQVAASVAVTQSAISAWKRAANVRIVPVVLCASARAQVARVLGSSGKIRVLQNAVAADVLLSAALNRTRYDAGDVYAVERNGSQITVYVF